MHNALCLLLPVDLFLQGYFKQLTLNDCGKDIAASTNTTYRYSGRFESILWL